MKRALALVLVAACGPDHGITGDNFPIGVDVSTGPVLAEVREGDGAVKVAVIDLLAPLTVLDVDEDLPPARRFTELTLLGTGAIPRAHLELTVTELHACPGGAPCRVGPAGGTTNIEAVIGADAFDTGAVRVDLAAGALQLFPDIAGDATARGKLCEAVFSRPFRGGGNLSIAGTQVSFPARRIAINGCLHHDNVLLGDNAVDRGADVLLVLSTGIGRTILSTTAYERYRVEAIATGDDPGLPAEDLTKGQVFLPSGAIEGGLATIDRLALVGGDNEVRGPCRQVYAHHLLSDRSCEDEDDCPCSDGSFCRIPAVVELAPAAPIDVLVVPDDDPTLQALRLELRPEAPEVDGILGTGALAPTSFDVDTPNDRLLVRCESFEGCRAWPELITETLRSQIEECRIRADAGELGL